MSITKTLRKYKKHAQKQVHLGYTGFWLVIIYLLELCLPAPITALQHSILSIVYHNNSASFGLWSSCYQGTKIPCNTLKVCYSGTSECRHFWDQQSVLIREVSSFQGWINTRSYGIVTLQGCPEYGSFYISWSPHLGFHCSLTFSANGIHCFRTFKTFCNRGLASLCEETLDCGVAEPVTLCTCVPCP